MPPNKIGQLIVTILALWKSIDIIRFYINWFDLPENKSAGVFFRGIIIFAILILCYIFFKEFLDVFKK
jgi:hypothetical protein